MEQCKRMLAHLHDLASSRSRHGTTQGAAGPPPRPGLLSPRRRREELQAVLHSLLPSSLLISFSHNFYFFMCMFFIYACEVFDETTRRQHVFILYARTEEDEDIHVSYFLAASQVVCYIPHFAICIVKIKNFLIYKLYWKMKTFRGLKPRKEEYDGGSQCKAGAMVLLWLLLHTKVRLASGPHL